MHDTVGRWFLYLSTQYQHKITHVVEALGLCIPKKKTGPLYRYSAPQDRDLDETHCIRSRFRTALTPARTSQQCKSGQDIVRCAILHSLKVLTTLFLISIGNCTSCLGRYPSSHGDPTQLNTVQITSILFIDRGHGLKVSWVI